jgi:hypothetical protein
MVGLGRKTKLEGLKHGLKRADFCERQGTKLAARYLIGQGRRRECAMQRRSTPHGTSLKDFFDQEAKAYRALADKLAPSPERDALLLKARQAETASQFVK